jgi:Glycosyltransferase family 10 (fucosyltransferase) C-term
MGVTVWLQIGVSVRMVLLSVPPGELPPAAIDAETRNRDSNPTAANVTLELFMDRLNRLVPPTCTSLPPEVSVPTCVPPGKDDRRLFVEDVAKIERELLQFDIPREVVIDIEESHEYVSLIMWRWLMLIDGTRPPSERMCPNCRIRHPSKNTGMNETPVELYRTHPGDVKIDFGCPSGVRDGFRGYENQIVIGSCGESLAFTGASYYGTGRMQFDFDAGFVDYGQPFHKTYAHLHLSPPAPEYNLTELYSVTDMVRELLRPPPITREGDARGEEAMFTHNYCDYWFRAKLVGQIIESGELGIAAYSQCFNNRDGKSYEPQEFYFGDSEGTRDSVKTLLSSLHKFTFSLENTLSRDYFTEKRYQALLARSVPIVWNNDNSLDFLPDPDAAVLVDPVATDPVALARQLRAVAANETEYAQFFAWKRRGLRADFVRRLFLSSDFQACRICEYVAHHYPPPPPHLPAAP